MAEGLSNAEVVEVYRTHGHLLLRRCRIVLRDDHLADDALQEAFVKIMRYGGELRTADSKIAWLYRVADRCCFDLLAKQKRRGETREPPEDVPGQHPDPFFQARDSVMAFLKELDDKDRQIAVFAYVDGLSQGEIAKETGFSRQTINKRLQRIQARADAFRGAA